jgi:hypothetical protein
MDILTLEDETTTLSQNIRHQSPSKVKPHPKRTETSSFEIPHKK